MDVEQIELENKQLKDEISSLVAVLQKYQEYNRVNNDTEAGLYAMADLLISKHKGNAKAQHPRD